MKSLIFFLFLSGVSFSQSKKEQVSILQLNDSLLTISDSLEKKQLEKYVSSQKTDTIFEFIDCLDCSGDVNFPGGSKAYKTFLKQNIVYPQIAINQNLEGKVYFQGVIKANGELSNLKITKGIQGCSECSDEVLRVFKLSPKWIPQKRNGEAIDSIVHLSVQFKLKDK